MNDKKQELSELIIKKMQEIWNLCKEYDSSFDYFSCCTFEKHEGDSTADVLSDKDYTYYQLTLQDPEAPNHISAFVDFSEDDVYLLGSLETYNGEKSEYDKRR